MTQYRRVAQAFSVRRVLSVTVCRAVRFIFGNYPFNLAGGRPFVIFLMQSENVVLALLSIYVERLT